MKILSIDTSSNICGVAILEDDKLIKEINLDNGLTHSQSLMPTINSIFKETGMQLSEMDLLVSDKGPGSFTGIRIGTSTVMAFSDSLGIPVCGICSLEALAYNVKQDGIICSLIDARNNNCYCGIYKIHEGTYSLIKPLIAEHIDVILNNLIEFADDTISFVGNGAIINKEKIINNFSNAVFYDKNDLNAYNLGLAGFNAYSSGKSDDAMPLYLRKSQAERLFL